MAYEPEGYVLVDGDGRTQAYTCGMGAEEVLRAVEGGMMLEAIGADGGRRPATIEEAVAPVEPSEASSTPDDAERWQAVLAAVEALADATGTEGAAQGEQAATSAPRRAPARAAAVDPVAAAVARLREAVGGATQG